MDELLNQLYEKRKKLNTIIKDTTLYLETAPEGILHIIENHSSNQYYIRQDSKDFNGTYISKKNT